MTNIMRYYFDENLKFVIKQLEPIDSKKMHNGWVYVYQINDPKYSQWFYSDNYWKTIEPVPKELLATLLLVKD